MRAQCVSDKAKPQSGRSVFVVEDKERLIRAHLERREQADFQTQLSKRVIVERVIAGFAQCGGKVAHRFGHDHVEFDASLSALGYNLRRLASLLSSRPELPERLESCQQRARDGPTAGRGSSFC